MPGRVKADCEANSIEHSYALTHLIPVGLPVIGHHLGSACPLASGRSGVSVFMWPPKLCANAFIMELVAHYYGYNLGEAPGDYSLAYLNSGSILRPSFVPPGSSNFLSTNFRLS